jgi:hypothetical protein
MRVPFRSDRVGGALIVPAISQAKSPRDAATGLSIIRVERD